MAKVIKVFAYLVIILFTLSVFGWLSVHVSKEDKDFGFLNEPVKKMYSFLDLFSESVEEAKTFALPKTFIKTPEDFQPINKLDNDLIVLTAFSDTGNTRTVALVNLLNDSMLHRWNFNDTIEDFKRIFHPLLLPDNHLVYSFDGSSLSRVDSEGNVIWDQDGIWPHHSKNLDANGDIWLSTYNTSYAAPGMYKMNDKKVLFKDEYINKVDAETGEILFHKSMAELLTENGLYNYLIRSGDVWDPIHTNDVQPVLKDGPYFKKDDIFISTKNLSAILHYRPSTNELIKVFEGPFNCPHDVDIYNDHSIVFFNNNSYPVTKDDYQPAQIDSSSFFYVGDLYSSIVQYDYISEKFSFVADSILKANKIYTMTEGLIEFYEPNMCFIEQQNSGVLWIIKEDEVIYKNVLNSFHKGFHHLPNWTRIIKSYE